MKLLQGIDGPYVYITAKQEVWTLPELLARSGENAIRYYRGGNRESILKYAAEYVAKTNAT